MIKYILDIENKSNNNLFTTFDKLLGEICKLMCQKFSRNYQ